MPRLTLVSEENPRLRLLVRSLKKGFVEISYSCHINLNHWERSHPAGVPGKKIRRQEVMKRFRALLLSYCPISLVEQAGFAPATSSLKDVVPSGIRRKKVVVRSRWTVVGTIQSISTSKIYGDKIGESSPP